ncbi:MAG: hypothetical protein OEY34_10710 [Cyclobacteriaceae bacterium]|nr:hypothetical protein [Cyclobacteriaceae bacterium]
MPAAAFGTLLFATNCKDKTPVVSKDDLLAGDWKVTEVNGQSYETQAYANYITLWKFAKTGDFNYCYENTQYSAYNGCYAAKWKWTDVDKTKINIDFAPIKATIDLSVNVLDGDNLAGTATTNYDYYGYVYTDTKAMKFRKIK